MWFISQVDKEKDWDIKLEKNGMVQLVIKPSLAQASKYIIKDGWLHPKN